MPTWMVMAGALYGYPAHGEVGLGHSFPKPLDLTVAPPGGTSIGVAYGCPPGSAGSSSLITSSADAQTLCPQYCPNPTCRRSGFTSDGRWNGPAIHHSIARVIRCPSVYLPGGWNMTSLWRAALMPSGV